MQGNVDFQEVPNLPLSRDLRDRASGSQGRVKVVMPSLSEALKSLSEQVDRASDIADSYGRIAGLLGAGSDMPNVTGGTKNPEPPNLVDDVFQRIRFLRDNLSRLSMHGEAIERRLVG